MNKNLRRAQKLLNQPRADTDEIISLLKRVLKKNGSQWLANHLMGMTRLRRKEYQEAIGYFEQAVKYGAKDPGTYHFLSKSYFEVQDFEKAEFNAHRSVELKENYFEGWMQLGAAFRAQGKLNEALHCYQKANQIDPKSAEVAFRIASIYRDQSNPAKALELFDITLKLDPKYLEAYTGKADILRGQNKLDEAEEILHQSLEVNGNFLKAKAELAEVCKVKGDYDEALAIYEKLLEAHPNVTGLRVNYALCQLETGNFEESEKNYLQAFKEDPNILEALSNYLMGLHYNPERTKGEIFEAHLLWDKQYSSAFSPERPVPENREKGKKLRIGLLSGGLRAHPVGWMITLALENLPKDQFEIYAYSTHGNIDFITKRIYERSDAWRPVVGYTEEVIAGMIREDEIDILLELSGHSAGNRLHTINREPAPIIVKWVGGLFNTSGLKAMDFLITDWNETPEGEEKFYTEKLVRMPDDYICFLPPDYAPEIAELPALSNDGITFGCFNNPTKINNEILEIWAKIIQKVPKSRLFLKSRQYDTKALRTRIIEKMNECGVTEDRLIFEGASPHVDLLECYNRVDIALDPWPYSGGLTTCEALWMGVPVITKPGTTFAGRHSTTHLINAGFPEWVTGTWEEYITTVVSLVEDLKGLNKLRQGMREKVSNSPLCDGERFGTHLSIALRKMWEQWVEGYERGNKNWQDHIVIDLLANDQIKYNTNKNDVLKQVNDMEEDFTREKTQKVVGHAVAETNVYANGNGYHINGLARIKKESEPEVYKIDTKDGVTICTPPDTNQMTPYVLLEKRQWYENEIDFIRDYLSEGMHAVDAGAGFGTYALLAAKLVGKEGKVFSFEPGTEAKKYLEMSKLENDFENIEVIGKAVSVDTGKKVWKTAETPELNKLDESGEAEVAAVTLDAWWQFEGKPTVDLLKIDINGHEAEALKGAAQLLEKETPVLLLSIVEEKSDAFVGQLSDLGYKLFEYIPGPGILTEHEVEMGADVYMQNVIAIHENQLEEMRESGWLYDKTAMSFETDTGLWKTKLSKLPWTHKLMEQWENHDDSEGIQQYLQALNYLVTAEKVDIHNLDLKQPRSQKAKLLLGAAQILVGLYNQGANSTSVVFTLIRALNALGKRGQAVEVMQNLIESTKLGQENMNVDLPFMLPIPEQDETFIKTDLPKWLMVRTVEAWILLKDWTTYLSGPQEKQMLEVLEGNPEVIDEINRIIKLLNNDIDVQEKSNLNTLATIESNNEEIEFFRSDKIDLIDVAKENYQYSDKQGVAIIMPCIDKKLGLKTAKALVNKAGIPCKVIIAFDSVGKGFMNTLNKVAKQIDVRYVVYLAQDAFPGMYWLKKAYNKLEETGKSLLGFNDGKWNGVIASFGMVRVSWVKKLYGNAILCPEYKSHCADDELTAIARATDNYIYDPNITLFEVDYGKALTGGGNQKDRQLLYNRFATCFDGLAPRQELVKISSQYNVGPGSIKNGCKESTAEREDVLNIHKYTPIIVVGMHRSGTSLLTRVLADLGVFMGNDLSINHESAFFQRLNVRVFEELGGRWDSPPNMDDLNKSEEAQNKIVSFLRNAIKSFQFSHFLNPHNDLEEVISKFGEWGWKDPRNVYTLPLWLKVFPNSKVIFIERHGVDVAKSLRKRALAEQKKSQGALQEQQKKNGLSSVSTRCSKLKGGLDLWNEYNAEALKNLKKMNDDAFIKIKYEQLLTNPNKTIEKIHNFIGNDSLNKNCNIRFDESRAFAYKEDSELLNFALKNVSELNSYSGE